MTVSATSTAIGRQECKSILGQDVASIDWDDAIVLLGRLIAERRFTKVGFMNAHNANVACSNPEFAAAIREFLLLPDGVGVDVAARILYGASFPANLNGTDFVPALIAASKTPLKIGLLGARRENAEAAARKLRVRAPQHQFIVVDDGFFAQAQEPALLKRLETLRPDILLVAMGVPRQELWIARNLTSAHCTLPIAVGALFDFLSGAVPRAPASLRRLRLEWLYRLWLEPGRLWRRYVVGNPLFLARVLRQKLAGRGAPHGR